MSEKARLGEILLAAGEITPAELEAGLAEQRGTGRPLGMTLVRMGVLDEETLIRRLSKQLSLPMARLRGKRVSPEVMELVPAELAEKYHCVPLFTKQEAGNPVLYLGMEDATNLDAMDDVAARIGMSVRPVLVATTEIDEALERYRDEAANRAEAQPLSESRDEAPPEPLPPPAAVPGFPDDEPEFALGEGDGIPGELELAAGPPWDAGGAGEADDPNAWDTGSEPDFDLDLDLELDLGAEPAPAAPIAAPVPESVSQDAILRALCQLLVEKGVIGRDELIERVDRESAAPGARRHS